MYTKRWGFDSVSENIQKLQVRFPVGAHKGGNQSMFLSHLDVSLSPVPSSSLSLKSIRILKKKKEREGCLVLWGRENDGSMSQISVRSVAPTGSVVCSCVCVCFVFCAKT